MKKLYLPALLLLVFCSCTNNQETVDKGKINSVETRSVEVKSVRDYIESDEFISIIPDEYYALRQKGKMSEEEIKAADYQMKAAAYRFYKHCTMDDKGFIIRKSKFPLNPERSVQFSGKRTKRSVQKIGCTQHL